MLNLYYRHYDNQNFEYQDYNTNVGKTTEDPSIVKRVKRNFEEIARKPSSVSKKSGLNTHSTKEGSKKMFSKNIGGKTNLKTIVKSINDSLQSKDSRDKSNITKVMKKSRNDSKGSIGRIKEPEMKTFTTVLMHRKSKDLGSNNSLMIGSPEEINAKMRSDKTHKSSLTSSTTTHTNNMRKKRGSDKSIKKRKTSCFGPTGTQDPQKLKNKGVKTTAVKYDYIRSGTSKYDKRVNVTIDPFENQFEFDTDNMEEHNQTLDIDNTDRIGTLNTVGGLKEAFKNRHSISTHKLAPKIIRKLTKNPSKSRKPNLKIKKSTYRDLNPQTNMSATFDNRSINFKEAISNRSGERKSSSKKRLTKIKSYSNFRLGQKDTLGLMNRKSSVGAISTSNLCHLPKNYQDPRTMKNDKVHVGSRLKNMVKGKLGYKSGSLTTKNKSKVSVSKKATCFEKPIEDKKTLREFRSSSTIRCKKIQSTKQPVKPADVKNEAVPENEGSSFKNSRNSLIKYSPPEHKEPRQNLSFIDRRHLSIQIDLYPRSEMKRSPDLQPESIERNWRTESKDKYINKEKIINLRQSPNKHEKSNTKNKSNQMKFEKKNMNYTEQIVVNDSSLDNIHETSDDNNDSVKRQLKFYPKVPPIQCSVSHEENTHPNVAQLKTDRTSQNKEGLSNKNKIPLALSKRAMIQNSAPQNKSKNEEEFLDVLFSKSNTRRPKEESKERSISNDKSSNKAGSNHSNGSKFIVQRITDSGFGSLQSSIHLSSHLSYNLSATDSA